MFVWALFAEVEKCARKFGAQRVELMVWSHNAIAQKAYAAYGMTLQRSIYEIVLENKAAAQIRLCAAVFLSLFL